ncbi:hypothetical protein [Acidisphaera rubrifaciens]|nr:hypothetical protein [Acidisphaera rubrifaciens]
MRRTLFAAATALSLGLGASAAMAGEIGPANVGSFIYDQNGAAIGSLRAIQGDQAVVWVGFYNTPGNHLTTVPLRQLSADNGSVVLSGVTPSQLAASN